MTHVVSLHLINVTSLRESLAGKTHLTHTNIIIHCYMFTLTRLIAHECIKIAGYGDCSRPTWYVVQLLENTLKAKNNV